MKLAYVDSSAWIARFEGLPSYKMIVNDRLTKLGKEGWNLCISQAVLLEVMPKPYRNNDISVIDAYNEVFEQTKILKSFANIFKESLEIARTENLKAMDAIHVAIAKHHNCKHFVSTDPHFKTLKAISPIWIDLKSDNLPD